MLKTTTFPLARLFLAAVALVTVAACSGGPSEAPPAETPRPVAGSPDDEAPLPETPSPYDALSEDVRGLIDSPFTGDFDAMVSRRIIRVGVTFSRTHYFIDRGQQRGLAYESLKKFEDDLNAERKTGHLKIHMVFVPLPRNLLSPSLVSGKVDLVAAMLTVTPEREALVAFSEPTRSNVNEIVVTGPGAAPIATVDDLSGREVFVRKTSSYYASLQSLNKQLASRGRPPVVITEAPEVFEDDDLLEMVNAGLAPAVVVDDYMADFWSKVFTNVTVHHGVAVRTGGNLAIAVRKDSPGMREAANKWLRANKENDLFRKVLERRYLQSLKFVKNSAAEVERQKFRAVVALFEKYGAQYELDYVLMAAQGYQESTLDQNAKSSVGAVGIMQVMPATGKELNVGDIGQLEPNVHAGVKYMRFMMDRYFANEPMDQLNKGLMTFASYNAGPGRVRQLRRETEKRGLDPNVWFGNVERVASERIGRETVQYVSNIYKYYVAYRLALANEQLRKGAKAEVGVRP